MGMTKADGKTKLPIPPPADRRQIEATTPYYLQLVRYSSFGDYAEISEDEARDSLAKAEHFLSELKRATRSILEDK